jgi:cbb3-type cytochrome oxidase maturation protein
VNAYLIILPLALALSGVFLWLFLRAARRGQFEDLEDPPRRILHDDQGH